MTSTISTNRADKRPSGSFSLSGYRLWLGIIAMILLPAQAPSESVPAAPQTPVRGEIVLLTAELVVVKSADGTSILIPLGKHATVDRTLKTGDRVEVVVTEDQQVRSVNKIAP